MSKKKTQKVEILREEGPNLSGATKLEFTLNKNDIIDYYMVEEEEKLEGQIDKVAGELASLQEKIDQMNAEIYGSPDEEDDYYYANPKALEDYIKEKYASDIIPVKNALNSFIETTSKFLNLGKTDYKKKEDEAEIIVEIQFFQQAPKTPLKWRCDNELTKVVRSKRQPLKGTRRQLARDVPESKLHDLELHILWSQYFERHSMPSVFGAKIRIHKDDHYFQTQVLEFKLPKDLEKKVRQLVNLKNQRPPLIKELHDLLIVHSELPQIKKQIKKNVVGRVLKNTDSGKLLLDALKGIRELNTNLTSKLTTKS